MAMCMSIQEVHDLLDNISTLIGGFLYDKAKESLEREREATKLSPVTSWNVLVNGLIQLSLAEKSYMSLMFLAHKSFLRKDSSARVCYEALSLEYQRVADGLTDSTLDLCLLRAYRQLLHFVRGRLTLLEFYEKLWLVGSGKMRGVSELTEQLENFASDQEANFDHPHLAALKAVVRYEVRTLLSMLRTQEQLETWQFLPALMSLNEAHTHLNKFSACVQSRETRRLLFRRASQEPELIQWLQRLRAALVATFSLYFREVLSAQSSGSEFKALCAKTAADHFARLQSFQRKMDAALVALAFDGTEEAVRGGLGYRHPEQRVPPAGQHPKPYPAVLCCSKSDVQAALWPEVVAALAEPKLELSSSRVSHAWLGPSAAQSAFFLAISDCLTLVVVFDGRRSEKDSYVTSFMLETAAALRCIKIYHSLRPGAK
ncbi:KICSTOR complex protein C12orf66 [Amphibalanus amphitrite]|uniref:KICSTOR complex protein C12orf66 n=1 Tax=Amphibalanus amphitrite TaxID=1232801 RepID=A0A6A4WTV4_AMPAM|nr:KICSTOR complex protein C12orf66 [Amphibalanus amphitrite]